MMKIRFTVPFTLCQKQAKSVPFFLECFTILALAAQILYTYTVLTVF